MNHLKTAYLTSDRQCVHKRRSTSVVLLGCLISGTLHLACTPLRVGPDKAAVVGTKSRMDLLVEPSTGREPEALDLTVDRGGLPLVFEENRGQAPQATRFISKGQKHSVLFGPSGVQFVVPVERGGASASGWRTVGMTFVGANPGIVPSGMDLLPSRSNYLRGVNRSRWLMEVPHYRSIAYAGLYEGVGVQFYGAGGALEYDLVIAPGSRALDAIHLRFDGADAVAVDEDGDLVIRSGNAEVHQARPLIFQEGTNGERERIEGGYVLLADHQVGFQIGPYDRGRTLTIDPVLTFSTYLGGSDLEQMAGQSVATDHAGNGYMIAYTKSTDFPVHGAVDASYNGGWDCVVAKFASDGDVGFVTYLGGGDDDGCEAIATDSEGNVYLTGFTRSGDFPIENAFQSSNGGGTDAFVTKLSPSGALIYSTFLGGDNNDEGVGIAVDVVGAPYITGFTSSTYFPTRNAVSGLDVNPEPTRFNPFVAKLVPMGNDLEYSTYLGPGWASGGVSVAVDAAGRAHVGGLVQGPSFPVLNPFQTSWGQNADGFLTILSAGTGGGAHISILYSTYFGGSGSEVIRVVKLDSQGNIIVVGETDSQDLFLHQALNDWNDIIIDRAYDSFVTVFPPLGGMGTNPVASTLLGGANIAYGLSVDPADNIYVAGSTDYPQFRLVDQIPGAALNSAGAYAVKLMPRAEGYIYSTVVSSSHGALGLGIAADPNGNAWLGGSLGDSAVDLPINFPGNNPYQTSNHLGGGESFLVRIAQSVAPLTLSATKDSFLRSGNADRNEGANSRLRVQQSGHNRAVVAFDGDAIAGFVGSHGLTRATLVLTISDNANNWGASGDRTVDALPLLSDFAEGNGKDLGLPGSQSTRGSGPGVTWNCATDSQISNQTTNCAPTWGGGTFGPGIPQAVMHANGMIGPVSWDVTQDVVGGASAWIVKKTNESQSGEVLYFSKEGAAEIGDPDLAPRLILE